MYANYGFDSKAVDSDARLEAWQGGLVLSHTNDSGVNKVILRYSDNSDNSVYNKTDDLTTVYASFEGSHKFTQQAQVEYLLAFHDYDNGRDNTDNRKNYGAIVRPMYFWNDVHSTWLEAGYQRVDYDQGGDNHGWKLTLSQNIAIGMGPEFRPMLRFYVTGGQEMCIRDSFGPEPDVFHAVRHLDGVIFQVRRVFSAVIFANFDDLSLIHI